MLLKLIFLSYLFNIQSTQFRLISMYEIRTISNIGDTN